MQVTIVQWLVEAVVIVADDAPVLHQFDVARVAHASGPCHRVTRHDCHLAAAVRVPDCDGSLNGVKVRGDAGILQLLLVVLSLPELLVDHLQPVRIVPQLAMGVEIDHLPVDHDVLAAKLTRQVVQVGLVGVNVELRVAQVGAGGNFHQVHIETKAVIDAIQLDSDGQVSLVSLAMGSEERKVEPARVISLLHLDLGELTVRIRLIAVGIEQVNAVIVTDVLSRPVVLRCENKVLLQICICELE